MSVTHGGALKIILENVIDQWRKLRENCGVTVTAWSEMVRVTDDERLHPVRYPPASCLMRPLLTWILQHNTASALHNNILNNFFSGSQSQSNN